MDRVDIDFGRALRELAILETNQGRAMQDEHKSATVDRTRAIVAAAEKLAKAAAVYEERAKEAERRGDKDGPWCDEIVDALAEWKRALALPESPPPPQSAIDWLVSCADDARALTPTCDADREILDELREAVERYRNRWPAPNAPQWQSEPPPS